MGGKDIILSLIIELHPGVSQNQIMMVLKILALGKDPKVENIFYLSALGFAVYYRKLQELGSKENQEASVVRRENVSKRVQGVSYELETSGKFYNR